MLVHTPPPPLSRFVDYLWLQEGAPHHTEERVLPTGTTELVIALHDTPLRTSIGSDGPKCFGSSMVCGAQSSSFVIDTEAQRLLVGVHFRAGGAFPFFARPATELRDMCVGLDDLWGGAAAILCEQLVAAPDAATRFTLLERTLSAQAATVTPHPAVAHALTALDAPAPPVTIASIAKAAGLSAPRFIQLFSREVGLTPKLFARVRRLQAVLRHLEKPSGARWVEVALAHGYFDQAHLIRDFQQFTGLTPTAYLARGSASPNHIALP